MGKTYALMPMRSDERLAVRITTDVIKNLNPRNLLDIGCGDGIVGDHLSCNYRGLDITDASIYERRKEKASLSYIQAEKISELLNKEGPWDTILLLDVLEHTKDFTSLFREALCHSTEYVVVSIPNELFILDRLRMLLGKELNAHSLDLINQQDGFKHQYIINIKKARYILMQCASEARFSLSMELARPLRSKNRLLQPFLSLLHLIMSDDLWSMGNVFIFKKES